MKPRKCLCRSLLGLISFYFISFSNAFESPPSGQVNTQDYCRSLGRALGRCVPLQDCALFSNWLKQRPILKQNVKTVVKFTCYFDIEQPKVCCPLPEIGNKDDATSSYNLIQDHFGHPSASGNRKLSPRQEHGERLLFPDELFTGTGEDLSKRINEVGGDRRGPEQRGRNRNLNLLPSLQECGSSIKLSRHVGTFGAYPWMAVLGNKDPSTGNWVHVCSGTLINAKYILTSAHCLNKNEKYPITHIRLGEYDLETRVDRGSPFLPNTVYEEFPLRDSITHPNYEPTTGQNDIALIRLQGNGVKYSNYIRPICLPLKEEYDLSQVWGSSLVDPNAIMERRLLVAGWGRLDLNSTGYRILQEAQVKITPSEDCRDGGNLRFSPTSQYCIGGNYRDSICQGDDGGGLLLPMRLGSNSKNASGAVPKVFQIGVFSSGPSSAQCQNYAGDETDHRLVLLRRNNRPRSANLRNVPAPGIYTKVIPHLDWILDQLQP